jgi:predicted GNAT superfamily acetyltransferase
MTSAPEIRIEPLTAQDQLRDAVKLQKEIWQFEDVDLLPVRLFVVATKIGGQVFGAYHDKKMVGFALAIPGIKPGYGGYLHSHMVGVAASYRNYGVGRMLKLTQRQDAIARGVDLMEWTFDPLELKNAYFNIERLGAVVRRYVRNQYGISTSVLHSGLPTDRCIAEWWLSTERVRRAVVNEAAARPEVEGRISVPNDIADLRKHDFARAKQIQAAVSDQFLASFAGGLAVIGFERTAATGDYLLGRWQ